MSRFSAAGHLIAWAGLCPGQNESAGQMHVLAAAQRRSLTENDPASLNRRMRARRGTAIKVPARDGGYERRAFLS
jgi:hypothetical protein